MQDWRENISERRLTFAASVEKEGSLKENSSAGEKISREKKGEEIPDRLLIIGSARTRSKSLFFEKGIWKRGKRTLHCPRFHRQVPGLVKERAS